MNWIDESFLISKNRYNENSLIAEVYTKSHGKISGIIFGATSKKIKNYLQIGNRLHLNYSSKNDNRIGYFKIEILNAYSPLYFDNRQKLSCITSATNLIKILTVEAQANTKVYKLVEKLFLLLKDNDWIKKYIFWELELLKILGYDLEIENLVKKDVLENKTIYYVTSFSDKKYVKIFEDEIKKEQLGSFEEFGFKELLDEYDERKTDEAKIAKDADLLGQIILLKEYEWQGNKEATVWLKGKRSKEKEYAKVEELKTKSGIMLGLGETKNEVLQVMDDLIAANVDFLTIGQYLQPSVKHYPLKRYVHPDEFMELKELALSKGFLIVASSPLTRSSYHADEDFAKMKKLREKQSQCHLLQ